MLSGLRKASEQRDADMILANPVLPDDILNGKPHLRSEQDIQKLRIAIAFKKVPYLVIFERLITF